MYDNFVTDEETRIDMNVLLLRKAMDKINAGIIFLFYFSSHFFHYTL